MTAMAVQGETTKPVYSPSLICHHPTSSNPEVLKGFALAMLKGEGYYSGSEEFYDELLTGQHILMTTVTDADHTGIAVVSTKKPVEYRTPSESNPGGYDSHKISLFVAVSVTNEDQGFHELLEKIQSWDDDKLLTERIGQATFEQVWANISGEKHLPKVASEYTYHQFTMQTDSEEIRHFSRHCIALMKKLESRVEIRNISKRTKFVNAKSFTGLLSLGIVKGHQVEIRVLGNDAEAANTALHQAVYEARKSYLREQGQK